MHSTGLEPVTLGSEDRCSIQLSYECAGGHLIRLEAVAQQRPWDVHAGGVEIFDTPAKLARRTLAGFGARRCFGITEGRPERQASGRDEVFTLGRAGGYVRFFFSVFEK